MLRGTTSGWKNVVATGWLRGARVMWTLPTFTQEEDKGFPVFPSEKDKHRNPLERGP